MSVHKTIVTYREIELALAGKLESALDATAHAADANAPEFEAQLSDALQALEKEENGPGKRKTRNVAVMASAQNQLASIMQTLLARQAVERGSVAQASSGALEAKFDRWDFGWILSLRTWIQRLTPHPLLRAPDEPEPLPNEARIGLLADWGTGLYGAPVSAESLKKDGGFHLVMHLGDIYYSGDADEVRDRFLQFWPRIPGATNRALNGNHEMYTGGNGYFEEVLRDFDQRASYFAYQNDNWLLVGLDTAYEDHDLAGDQLSWLNRLIEQAGTRTVILFSHHQPFSLLEKQGPKLVQKLGHLLTAGRIFAWYWGHEHRCLLYDQHPRWQMYGRCIGHGGMPYFRSPFNEERKPNWVRRLGKLVPPALVLDGPNQYVEGAETEYGPQGYLTLHLKGKELWEFVHLPDGTILRDKQLC